MRPTNGIPGRFFRRPAVIVCLALLGLLTAACLLAPVLAPFDPAAMDLSLKFAPPSPAHPLGTDYLGRDILSRVLWGGRNTMGYAVLVTIFSALLGTGAGMLSGWIGGWTDEAVTKASDVLRAFPSIVLVLIIVSALGIGIRSVCLAMLITRWIWYARVARSLTRAELTRTSIMASRLAGSRRPKLLVRHILPAILPQMLAVLAIDFGSTLLAISGYSFLGLGILAPLPEWGAMINDGRNYMEHPGMMFWPGLCVLLVVIAVNLLGDCLRDALEENRT